MPSDRELESIAAHLAGFSEESRKHHKTLTEVLTKYDTLLEDYKRLRSDFEEERDSRERYKQMARIDLMGRCSAHSIAVTSAALFSLPTHPDGV